MNKLELQKLLKPLIKECVKEVIFESGILSKLITEVANGINNADKVVVKEIIRERVPVRENVDMSYEDEEIPVQKKKPARNPELVAQQQAALKEAAQAKQKKMSEVNERIAKMTGATGFAKMFENVDASSMITETRSQSNSIPSQAKMEAQGTALKGIAPNDPGVNINGILSIVGGSFKLPKMKKEES